MPYRDETERIIANAERGCPKLRDRMIENHRKDVEADRKAHPEVFRKLEAAKQRSNPKTFFFGSWDK